MDGLDYLAVAGASLAAGMVNALAGGGTLISFPTLVGLGVPALSANVTNTVALVPGYLSGTYAQRDDLRPQVGRAKKMAVLAAVGGLGGSVLLVVTPGSAFRVAVPYLILLASALLLTQDHLRRLVDRRAERRVEAGPPGTTARRPWAIAITVCAAGVYGGYFGAGMGIMLLAVLGLFSDDSLVQVNAVKQLLQFSVNVVAAVFFCFSGHVRWELVPVMAVGSLAGGTLGGRLTRRVNVALLRWVVVVTGVAVAIAFWLA